MNLRVEQYLDRRIGQGRDEANQDRGPGPLRNGRRLRPVRNELAVGRTPRRGRALGRFLESRATDTRARRTDASGGPNLYGRKSAEWADGLEFIANDRPGFW